VGVRGLGSLPDGQLAGDPVEVRDRAARLERRGVDPRVEHVLRDDHLGVAEHLLGRPGVAGLPVEDVVRGAPRLVVADERRAGVKRAARVDHRGQRLVVHHDQLERVPGGVAVLGDDERYLLALEPNLVGGEHGLPVAGQRGHPGQVERGQRLPGEDGLDLRVGLGREGIDGQDPRVRVRAAQHRSVEHAGQADVVHVQALAADEPLVLLAEPPAEPGWRRPVCVRHPGSPRPVRSKSAAQRTDLTMFS
jgi:hypothetical protein